MAPNVDPAILEALGLDPATTKIATHGGSGFSSTFRLVSTVDGEEVSYFVKTGSGKDAEVMFTGEHTSLNAIHATVPSLCPQSLAHGPLTTPNHFFLATEFLDLSARSPPGTGLTLAQKLAKLHTTPAPIPPGHTAPQYGFPVPTCCGSTVQPNGYAASWAEFFARNRLAAIVAEVRRNRGRDALLEEVVGRTVRAVVPRLLGGRHAEVVRPVVVHGDLWSGNHGRGRIVGRRKEGEGPGGVEEVVFDPSCVWGVAEYELGIMRMFGGFGGGFWKEYEKLVPKAEPVEEWEDRILLYEAYHHLNHTALFGGGYRSSALSILKKLNAKYGDD